MVLKTEGGGGESKHLPKQLAGHTTIGLQINSEMRIHSTISKLSSKQVSFTLRRLWRLGQALCCVHLPSQLFTVTCRDFSFSHYLEKWTLQIYRPGKKCRSHCFIDCGSFLGRIVYKSSCWGQEKLNQIFKKHCTLHWFRKSPIHPQRLLQKELHQNMREKRQTLFLLWIGAKPKALENPEHPPCSQINLPLWYAYCC